jgi:hypothetical protein
MLNVDSTFQAAHEQSAKQPLYYLEIDDVDIIFASFPADTLIPGPPQGYGIQGYGMVGYGF